MSSKTFAGITKHEQTFKARTPMTIGWACNTSKSHPTAHSGKHTFTLEERELSAGGHAVKVHRVVVTDPPGLNSFYKSSPADRRTTKDRVILHYTAGPLEASLGALMLPDHDRVSTPYVLGRDGMIYELFEDEYWAYSLGLRSADLKAWGKTSAADRQDIEASSVAIEIINVGWLREEGKQLYLGSAFDGSGKLKAGALPYCSLEQSEAYHVVNHQGQSQWRHQKYFASYTDAQYQQLRQLLLYLTAKYDIPYRFLDVEMRYEKFPPLSAGTDWVAWRGIVSHVNFRDDATSESPQSHGKWDIGPAFDWDAINPSPRFALPMDVTGELAAVKDAADPGAGPRDKILITRENLDAAYKHTEKDTPGGFYPIGENTVWHGGLHLFAPKGEPALPVVACARGEVIAARLGVHDPNDPLFYGSNSFILLRHRLDESTIRQLWSMYRSQRYTLKTAPDKDDDVFAADQPLPEGFRLRPGDVFERADQPESKRARSSTGGRRYPVKLVALAPALQTLQGYTVSKDGVVKFRRTAERKDDNVILALIKGDKLGLIKERPNGRSPKSGFDHVVITSLAEGRTRDDGYIVKTDYFNFRSEARSSTAAGVDGRDMNRLGDLRSGDKLRRLDMQEKGVAEGKGKWFGVELIELAAGADAAEYTMKTSWSFREQPSSSSRLFMLQPGDRLEILERRCHPPGGAYDRVRLAGLEKLSTVSVVRAVGTPLLAGASATAEKLADLKRGDKLAVVEKPAGNAAFIQVQSGGGGTGWVKLADCRLDEVKVKPGSTDIRTIRWRDGLLAAAPMGVIDVPKSTDASISSTRTRRAAVGLKGYVLVGSGKELEPYGPDRRQVHADKVATPQDPKGRDGYVEIKAGGLAGFGKDRQTVFAAALNTTGQVTFDKERMNEDSDIDSELKARLLNDGQQYFYSLYMHLNNAESLPRDEDLKHIPWLPRAGDNGHSGVDAAALERLRSGQIVHLGRDEEPRPGQTVRKYPQVQAGDPLWLCGEYGPQNTDRRLPLVHWEIFSENNLLPLPNFCEAADEDEDDYAMDCDDLLDILRDAAQKDQPGTIADIRRYVFLDIASAEVVAKIYQNDRAAALLRRFVCRFCTEWGVDLDKAVPKLTKRGRGTQRDEERSALGKLLDRYVGASAAWVSTTKNQIRPLLWWDAAREAGVPLPASETVWHYNPITFLETYSERDLVKQAESKGR